VIGSRVPLLAEQKTVASGFTPDVCSKIGSPAPMDPNSDLPSRRGDCSVGLYARRFCV